jgi:CheY-like chemotaxis protein
MFGGRSVAKILVADDNSNIQKMVGLALKDQGIDVVAVGNGEAAVRKISDIRPDLVLADVFMPVRNGYEVCKYVKDDASLSHIPVILLVGAFDPLDEQEAQRVGADGVLKKPFVPPDPLIAMVKSALTRAGVSYSGAPVDKDAEAASKKTADLLVPAAGAARAEEALRSVKKAVPEPEGESLPEEISARPAPVKFASNEQPLAFGSMLETPEVSEEDDPAFMPKAHPDLATERDWRSAEVEEEVEEEEEEAPKGSWRRDGADDVYIDDAAVSSTTGWHAAALDEKPATKNEELAGPADHISTPITETKSTSPVIPFSGDAWTAAIAPGSEDKLATAQEAHVAEVAAQPVNEEAALVAPFVLSGATASELHVSEPAKSAKASSPWFSMPASPWEAEAQKANQLAATWDVPAMTVPVAPEESKSPVETKTAESHAKDAEAAPVESSIATSGASEAPVTSYAPTVAEAESHEALTEPAGSSYYAPTPEVVAETRVPPAAVETIREEAASLLESAPEEKQVTDPAQETPKTSETDMDALVAKVLAKMSPEVLQAVTREILKPVVEAIVRDEISAKKP